jgi:hypothetical protein
LFLTGKNEVKLFYLILPRQVKYFYLIIVQFNAVGKIILPPHFYLLKTKIKFKRGCVSYILNVFFVKNVVVDAFSFEKRKARGFNDYFSRKTYSLFPYSKKSIKKEGTF